MKLLTECLMAIQKNQALILQQLAQPSSQPGPSTAPNPMTDISSGSITVPPIPITISGPQPSPLPTPSQPAGPVQPPQAPSIDVDLDDDLSFFWELSSDQCESSKATLSHLHTHFSQAAHHASPLPPPLPPLAPT